MKTKIRGKIRTQSFCYKLKNMDEIYPKDIFFEFRENIVSVHKKVKYKNGTLFVKSILVFKKDKKTSKHRTKGFTNAELLGVLKKCVEL
ncbi:MAG: hypothetical protein ACRC0V_06660 [Fusobacteriaceae bacterium]